MNEAFIKKYHQALSAAQEYFSEQTVFLHDDKRISIAENILYSLLLMKSHNKEKIEIAISILQRLLAYQKDGLFPLYLHDYPVSQRASFSFFPALYQLYREYRHIMPKGLREELKNCLFKMLEALEPYNFQSELTSACANLALGRITTTKVIDELAYRKDDIAWHRPVFLFEIYLALQILDEIPKSWSFFFEQIARLYCYPLNVFLLPSTCSSNPLELIFQEKQLPFPQFLQAALLRPFLVQNFERPSSLELKSKYGAFSLQKVQNTHLLFLDEKLFLRQEKDLCLFRFFQKQDHLSLQISCVQSKVYPTVEYHEDGVDFIFYFSKTICPDNKEKGQELELISNHELLVDGLKASYALEKQTICPKGVSFELSFEAIEGQFGARISFLQSDLWKLKIKTWEENPILRLSFRFVKHLI